MPVTIFTKDTIIFLLRLIIGLIFTISGFSKFISFEKFLITVHQFNILPVWFVVYFAIILPSVECISGLCFIFGLFIKKMGWLLFSLTIIFLLAIIINIIRENFIDCGCFGNLIISQVGWNLIFRDILISGIIFYILMQKEYIICLKS